MFILQIIFIVFTFEISAVGICKLDKGCLHILVTAFHIDNLPQLLSVGDDKLVVLNIQLFFCRGYSINSLIFNFKNKLIIIKERVLII